MLLNFVTMLIFLLLDFSSYLQQSLCRRRAGAQITAFREQNVGQGDIHSFLSWAKHKEKIRHKCEFSGAGCTSVHMWAAESRVLKVNTETTTSAGWFFFLILILNWVCCQIGYCFFFLFSEWVCYRRRKLVLP